MSYSSKGRKVRRRRKNLNIRNLVILIAGAVVAVILFILLITGAVRLISRGIGALTGDGKESSSPSSSQVSSEVSSESSVPVLNWTSVQMTEADERQGELILVNSTHEYRSEPEDLQIIYGNKTSSYGIRVAEMYLKTPALTALNNMMDAFAAATGRSGSSTLVTSTYRSIDEQQTLYENDLASTGLTTSDSVAQAGASEHHTGYALDMSYSASTGWTYLDGTGDYAWLIENCYKYGYIVRYTADKTSITGFTSEPWHFRYVGTVHAEAITKGGYCLEEYIEMLKLHDSANPYSFTSESGENYYIYYTPGDDATTDVPVLEGKNYSISGTNEGGFVTIVPLSSTTSGTGTDSTATSAEDGMSGTSSASGSSDSSASTVSGVNISSDSSGSSSSSSSSN